ncbi:MAG: YlbF family regulator [Bacilli bacterium]|nr:YlbF family regulator [Bacilli bacterium]
MIEEKQEEIIKKLDNSKEIKRFKELEKNIKNNKDYNRIIKELNKDNLSNEEIINLRKELFEIDEVREYASLESQIRLFSKKTSKKISSIVKEDKC